PRNAKQGRQVEKNRLGNEDGANGLIVQRLLRSNYNRESRSGVIDPQFFHCDFYRNHPKQVVGGVTAISVIAINFSHLNHPYA
ncbi:hypothetical protein, partial [Pseudomonas syringae]|uniref:hypothetical protein n=1 Tax=Pseudomonas syringae TaxID=317 RepID=UPI001FFB4B4B